ncbi:MAG: O-antigen ligase family protein [Candidatus Omnitrophota bacterium]
MLGFITLFIYRKYEFKSPFVMPIAIMLLSYLISHIFSVNFENSTKEIIRFISYIMIFSMVGLSNRSQKDTLIKIMVFSASIVSIYAIYQYFWGYDILLNGLNSTQNFLVSNSSYAKDILIGKRAISTFPSPNILGGYLIMMFFLALYLSKRYKIALIAVILISFALLLTKSMGAWLSLIVALIIYVVVGYKTLRFEKRIAIISSIFIVLALIFILLSRGERLINLENPQNSITQRIAYWKTAINIIKYHPIFGVGPGNFQEVFLKYKIGSDTDTRYAHNLFLQIWVELGILGLIGLIYLLSMIVKNLRTKLQNNLILFVSIVFMMHNIIDITYFIPQVSFFWWVILGILLRVTTESLNRSLPYDGPSSEQKLQTSSGAGPPTRI